MDEIIGEMDFAVAMDTAKGKTITKIILIHLEEEVVMDSAVMEIEVEIVTEEEIIIPKTVCSTLRRKTYKSPNN